MEVICIDHGDVFDTKTWFTFYCGKCKMQLTAGDKECRYCKEPAVYIGDKTNENNK